MPMLFPNFGGNLGTGGGGGGAGAVSFAAYRQTANSGGGGEITSYETVDHDTDSLLNTSTGRATLPTGVFFLGLTSQRTGAFNSGSDWRNLILKNSVDDGYSSGRNYNSLGRHRSSNFNPALVQGNGSDYYVGSRINGDTTHVSFSGAKIPTSTAFAAGGTGASAGSAVALSNMTELFDLGGDFDPTSGQFTVPADGLYCLMAKSNRSINAPDEHSLIMRVDALSWGPTVSLDHNNGDHNGSLGQMILAELTAGEVVTFYASKGYAQPSMAGFRLDDWGVAQYFAARKATASGSVGGDITGWTEDYDTDAMFDASTGVFTAPNAGKFLIFFTGRNNTMLSSAESEIQCLRDGASSDLRAFELGGFGGADGVLASHSYGGVVELANNEQLKLQQNGSIMKDCYFWAAYIGA